MGRLVPRLSRSQDQGQGATGAKKKRAATRNRRPMFCSLQNVDRRSKRCGNFVSGYLVRIPELGIKGD
ncbi:hypothetical protein JCM18916_1284 [Cutibacterium acnes JCM 18916]|nr:hypothetical protein JCM18916_1284 [Cutibacterium acnes JCM 18916]